MDAGEVDDVTSEKEEIMPPNVYVIKAALRKSMLRTLRAISESELDRQCEPAFYLRPTIFSCLAGRIDYLTGLNPAHVVTKILLEQPFLRDARSVGCYLSMAKGELRTARIVDEILRKGEASEVVSLSYFHSWTGAGTTLYTPYLPPAASVTSSYDSTSPSVMADYPPEMRMLRIYSPRDLQSCPLDKWGILDPGGWRRDVEEEVKREDGALTMGSA